MQEQATVRPKIITLLIKRLSTQMELLQMSELCDFAMVCSNDPLLMQDLEIGQYILSKAN